MAARENRIIRRRIVGAYLSSALSISLVLLLVGVASLLLVNTQSVSDYFKEHLAVSVIMRPEVSEAQTADFIASIAGERYVHSADLVTREQGEKEMAQMLGEDFLSVFASSPIPVSVNLTMNAAYVSLDSLQVVEKALSASPLVEEVVYQRSLIDALNANLRKISLLFAVGISLLLFISVALISNTMRLIAYDKRFTVHTMQLVGATRGFIRGPFLARAAFLGLFASLLAILMLLGILYVVRAEFAQLFEVFSLEMLLLVMGIVLGCGLGICVVSTWFVVGRLTSLDKDDLYY